MYICYLKRLSEELCDVDTHAHQRVLHCVVVRLDLRLQIAAGGVTKFQTVGNPGMSAVGACDAGLTRTAEQSG